MKPIYLLSFVAIAAVLSISLMLVNYTYVTGGATRSNIVTQSTLDKIDKCTARYTAEATPEGAREYCECITLYGDYSSCVKYMK